MGRTVSKDQRIAASNRQENSGRDDTISNSAAEEIIFEKKVEKLL